MTPCRLPGHRAVRAERGDFVDCYARELPGLVWFVKSLGASAEAAADAAQSAFTDSSRCGPLSGVARLVTPGGAARLITGARA